jgi:hypothetical protein
MWLTGKLTPLGRKRGQHLAATAEAAVERAVRVEANEVEVAVVVVPGPAVSAGNELSVRLDQERYGSGCYVVSFPRLPKA